MTAPFKQPCDEAAIRSGAQVSPETSRNGGWVLAATIIGSSIAFIDGTVINIALPILQERLNASVSEMQWIVESYALMLSALILVGGALGDRYGRRFIYMVGVIIFALSSLWCGMVSSATPLIVARTIQGIGAALLIPGSLAIISASFPKKDRGKAIGTWSAFTAISAGFGPILGGWLIQNVSWRWMFFINLPLAAIVLFICWRYVPESKDPDTRGRLDWLGAALVTIGLGGIVFGLTESGAYGFSHPMIVISFAIGLVSLIAFIFAERWVTNPMVPFTLFASKTFSGANLLTLMLYAGLGIIMFFLPFNFIHVHRYSATEAGAALFPFVLTMFLLSRWASRLNDRYGARVPLIVGPIVTAIGFLLFAIPGVETTNYWTTFFPAIMVMSFGMTLSVAPLTTTVMGSVDERHAGIASGINNAVSRTASLLTIAVLGVVMLASFSQSLDSRSSSSNFSPETKTFLIEQKEKFLSIDTAHIAQPETRLAAEMVIKNSFVDGFRLICFIAAGMALMGALSTFLFIENNADQAD